MELPHTTVLTIISGYVALSLVVSVVVAYWTACQYSQDPSASLTTKHNNSFPRVFGVLITLCAIGLPLFVPLAVMVCEYLMLPDQSERTTMSESNQHIVIKIITPKRQTIVLELSPDGKIISQRSTND